MARENVVRMYGQVVRPPQVRVNDNGERTMGQFVLKVLRRPHTNDQVVENKLYYAFPTCISKNEEIIKQIETMAEGMMVDVKGVVCTANTYRRAVCKECGNINTFPALITYIYPIFIQTFDVVDEPKGIELLKEKCEISNQIHAIGNLATDVTNYTDEAGRRYAQYEIGINRRYRIKEDQAETKADYPWVKTFGAKAYEDSQRLHVGSEVYINGAFQTRDVTRKYACLNEACAAPYTQATVVTEIVPYSIEYLKDCDEMPVIEDEEDENGEES